jgi:hypothetical protein
VPGSTCTTFRSIISLALSDIYALQENALGVKRSLDNTEVCFDL